MIVVGIVVALMLLAGGLLDSSGTGDSGERPPLSSEDNVDAPGWVMKPSISISYDQNTWPGGDTIWNICRAIAFAEGAYIPGSVPDRLNNPGDISDGASLFRQEGHSGSNVTVFPDKSTGWQWLYDKVSNAASGKSSVYSPQMTWTQIAQKWAGNWQAWVSNVSSYLGVDPNSTLQDYTG